VATSLRAEGLGVKTHLNFPDLVSVTVPRGVSLAAAQDHLTGLPQVAAAKPHLLLHQLDIPIPNDSFFIEDPFAYPNQYYLYDVNAPAAWDVQKGLASTVIGIVDSGISTYHEDLAANIVPGWDFVATNAGWDGYPGWSDDEPVRPPDTNATVWDPVWGQPQDKSDPYYSYAEDPDAEWGGRPILDHYGTAVWWAENYDPAIGDLIDNDFSFSGLDWDGGVTHGTMVAGLAGAVTDNNEQCELGSLAGMAWNCSLMPLRIINAEGWGFGVDAADAIIQAANDGVNVINCSWGFGPVWRIPLEEFEGPSEENPVGGEGWLVTQAIEYAVGKGVIIICAAGNSADPDDPNYAEYESMGGGLDFPANLSETISVGAIDWTGKRARYSSWANLDYEKYGEVLDIVAPGDMACSTGLIEASRWYMSTMLFSDEEDNPIQYPLGEDTYEATPGGTSFTAPLLSGFAGLAYSRRYGLTYQELRQAIRDTAYAPAYDPTPSEYDVRYGYGCLDAYEALLYIDPAAIPEPTTMALFGLGLLGLAARLRRRN